MSRPETTDVRIRPASPEDADFVLALVPQLLPFGPPPWRDARQMTDTDALVIARAVRGMSEGATVLVAEASDSKLLGFIHLCAETDYYARTPCGHIADIVVAPEARRRGVGGALLTAAEEWARARGYSMLTLNVFVENRHARALYERAGFRPETI